MFPIFSWHTLARVLPINDPHFGFDMHLCVADDARKHQRQQLAAVGPFCFCLGCVFDCLQGKRHLHPFRRLRWCQVQAYLYDRIPVVDAPIVSADPLNVAV